MEEGSKRRLVGAAVIVVLLVVFLPMLLEEDTSTSVPEGALAIPARPDLERPSASLAEPPDEPGTLPLPPELPPPALDDEVEAMRTDAPASDAKGARTPSDSAFKSAPKTASPPPPARAPAADKLSSWVVQVAAVTELARARDLENDLREQGFPAFVEQADVKGKTYYRVRVGPEADRERVKSMAASLKQKTGRDGLITRYP